MAATGPSFISLQVRDIERSAAFYAKNLGLARQPGPPHAVVFATEPIALAVREPLPGVNLEAMPQPGAGVALWLHAADTQQIHDALVADGTDIIAAPAAGPFGLAFTFADPDGYHVTLHDRM